MPDQLQLRGGTTTEHNSFTGALREVTVDTTKKTLVVHDGASAGGTPLMKESGSNAASSVQLGVGGNNKLTINSDGHIDIASNLDCAAGIDVTGDITATGNVMASGGFLGVNGTGPQIQLNDTDSENDFEIQNDNGIFKIRDIDAGSDRLIINSAGNTTFAGNLNANSGLDVTGSVAVSGSTDGVCNFDTSDSRGAFVRFGQGGSFHNMVGCADGLTSGDKEDLGVRAADNIIFAAGGSSEKMRLNATGQLGIGNSSPQGELHLGAANNSNHEAIIILNNGGATGNESGIEFRYESGTTPRAKIHVNSSDEILRFSTANNEAMQIDASQRVGIGTTSPRTELDLSDGQLSLSHRTDYSIRFYNGNGNNWSSINNPQAADGGATNTSELEFRTAVGVAMHMATDGKIGIGTTSPSRLLHLQKSSDFGIKITKTGSSDAEIKNTNSLDLCCSSGGSAGQIIRMLTGANTTSLNEVMRIDGGQKVAIGTTTTTEKLIVAGAIDFTGAATGNTANSGKLSFESATAFLNSKGPDTSTRGKIGFNIAASDGSLGYTAMKVQTGGQVTFGSNDLDPWNNTGNNPATVINATNVRGGLFGAAAHNGDTMALNRMGSDGAIIIFYGQGNPEGSIDVNGSTVSLTGGHLTRWSKIPSISDTDKSKRPTIYRGSVLTNLDAMCEWKRVQYTNSDNITKTKPYSGSEDVGSTVEYTDDKGDKYSAKVVLELNEQLNKMEVSSVEGDPNVAGVFQGWDDNDDVIVNDLYCAMTGDFVIRIAKGVTVKRGDLLMSAGDGTAKPQDDDIIRSKTVAKVTSTTVSTTYDDGSFCVPCVLMAC